MIKLLFVLCFLSIKPAFAYIDPGTGSMFVQALIAVLLLVPFYFYKVINFIKKKIFKSKDKENIDD